MARSVDEGGRPPQATNTRNRTTRATAAEPPTAPSTTMNRTTGGRVSKTNSPRGRSRGAAAPASAAAGPSRTSQRSGMPSSSAWDTVRNYLWNDKDPMDDVGLTQRGPEKSESDASDDEEDQDDSEDDLEEENRDDSEHDLEEQNQDDSEPDLAELERRDYENDLNEGDRADGLEYAIRADPSDPNSMIIGDMREELPYHEFDDKLNEGYVMLRKGMMNLINTHFSEEISGQAATDWLIGLNTKLGPEFVRYAGYIADGGPAAIAGWEQIFLEPQLRSALVGGIIWMALKQHVFWAVAFGGDEESTADLQNYEKVLLAFDDGFQRNRLRAENYEVFYQSLKGTQAGRKRFSIAVYKLAGDIYQTIIPLAPHAHVGNDDNKKILSALTRLVYHAAHLSQIMNMEPEAIYLFPYLAKDSPMNEKVMQLFSRAHHNWIVDKLNHPAATQENLAAHLTKDKVQNIRNYALLSRITVMDALEVWRKGGWRINDDKKGVRQIVLTCGRIACRWGAVRLFEHIDNGKQGRFVELSDCIGKLGTGTAWWTRKGVKDPAFAEPNVPVIGWKGRKDQPDLPDFKPRVWSSIASKV